MSQAADRDERDDPAKRQSAGRGGSINDEDAATASLNADLYDPATNTFSSAGANAYPRLYHSGSLLLPDATVMLAAETRPAAPTSSTSRSTRPRICSTPTAPRRAADDQRRHPGSDRLRQAFQVHTPDAANIASVVLVRPGAPTHAFDMDQRLVGCRFTVTSGVLNVTAPPQRRTSRLPATTCCSCSTRRACRRSRRFVRLSPAPPNQPPTAIITSPATQRHGRCRGAQSPSPAADNDPDGTISAYAWTFPGGTPASSSVAVLERSPTRRPEPTRPRSR